MAGCGDVLSLEDLQTAKKHQIFEAEVITGKAGGVASGADIDYATNQVTGQTQKTMPAILRDLGFEPASFDFTSGGTLGTNDRNKAVLWPLASGGDGVWYYWEGVLPKVIPAASTPASTGGVSDGAWKPVGDVPLRSELASAVGAALVSWQGSEAGQLKKTLADRFNSASVVDFATEYLTMAEIEQIKIDYTTGALDQKPTVDVTSRLIQAIADLGGSHDITSAYLYEPAKVLQLPAGAMGLNLNAMARVLVDRNNINIIGAGMFNTRLCHIGTGHANEMFRFKEAYACGLAHLTLDGGLPFTPVGTETYGVDIPLVLDQCAHFYSEGLNVCNYRHRGIQAIHLWESYLGNDLRCFNGGWFRVAGSTPGGLFFDDFRKESTFFPGSESNQVYVGKYAFSGNGSVVQFKSPCFNMRINQIVSEARTYGSYVPQGIDSPKVVVSGLSSGIVIDQAWYYFHDQATAAVGAGTVLFDFANAGPGCYFNNQVVYQEIPVGSSGRALEVSKLISNSSAHPVNLQMTVHDVNCSTSLFNGATPGSLVLADIYYRSTLARGVDSIIGPYGHSNMVGKMTISTDDFSATPPFVLKLGNVKSPIDGGGAFDSFDCRATANFNGVTNSQRMNKGFSSITRTATGQYSYVFSVPMPDANYAVVPGAVYANLGDNIEIGGMNNLGFSLVVRTAAGVFHDSPNVMVAVYR
jgi:hypothetical protein